MLLKTRAVDIKEYVMLQCGIILVHPSAAALFKIVSGNPGLKGYTSPPVETDYIIINNWTGGCYREDNPLIVRLNSGTIGDPNDCCHFNILNVLDGLTPSIYNPTEFIRYDQMNETQQRYVNHSPFRIQ